MVLLHTLDEWFTAEQTSYLDVLEYIQSCNWLRIGREEVEVDVVVGTSWLLAVLDDWKSFPCKSCSDKDFVCESNIYTLMPAPIPSNTPAIPSLFICEVAIWIGTTRSYLGFLDMLNYMKMNTLTSIDSHNIQHNNYSIQEQG